MVININNSRKKLRLYIPPVTQLKTNISTLTLDQSIPEGEAEITTIYGNSIKDENDIIHSFTATQLNTTQGVVELPTTTYFPNGMRSIGDYADEINQTKKIQRIYKITQVAGSSVHTSYSYETSNENAPFSKLYSKPEALSSVTYITEYPQCYSSNPNVTYCGTKYTKNTDWTSINDTSFTLNIGGNSYTYTKGSNVTWRTFGITEINSHKAPSKSINYINTNLTKFPTTDINYYYYHNTDNSVNFAGTSNQQFHVRCDQYTTLTQIRNAFSNGNIQIYTVLANPVETEITNDIKFPVESGDTISINNNNSTPLVADINFYKFKKDQVYKVNCPYPIKEVEYIQAQSGCKIVLNNTSGYTRYITHFKFMSNTVQQRILCSGYRAIYINGNKLLAYAQNNDWISSTLTSTNEYIVDMNTSTKKTLVYDSSGVLKKTTTHSKAGAAASKLWLFVQDDTTTARNSTAKLFSFQAYTGDTLSIDLIPVRVGQVGYMYDKISGQLFGNSGTGNFILGPDKQ